MIQFNLLPDVKLEYIKARRERRLVVSIAVIAVGVSVGLLVLVFMVGVFQKKHLSDLSADITKESKQLQDKPQINKVLTVQNQLQSIGGLHDGKPSASRLFGYLNELTPAQANITNLEIDFNEHTVLIEGDADALSTVNKYIDTLKFTTYRTNEDKEDTLSNDLPKAFSNVVLSTYGVATDEKQQDKPKVTYGVTLAYEPTIFDITKELTLVVPPNKVTTRSQLLQPTDLFTQPLENAPAEGTR